MCDIRGSSEFSFPPKPIPEPSEQRINDFLRTEPPACLPVGLW